MSLGLSLRGLGFSRGRVPQELLPEYCLPGCRPGCHLPSACLGGLRRRVVTSPSLGHRMGFHRVTCPTWLGRRHTSGRQPSDCTAHQLHPSTGKRACSPQAGPEVWLVTRSVVLGGKCSVFLLGSACCSFGCHFSFLFFASFVGPRPSPLLSHHLFLGRVCLSSLSSLSSVTLYLLRCARCLCWG